MSASSCISSCLDCQFSSSPAAKALWRVAVIRPSASYISSCLDCQFSLSPAAKALWRVAVIRPSASCSSSADVACEQAFFCTGRSTLSLAVTWCSPDGSRRTHSAWLTRLSHTSVVCGPGVRYQVWRLSTHSTPCQMIGLWPVCLLECPTPS